MKKIEINRKFRLWDCCVSHDQLMLRSAKGNEYENNIDIVFYGVKYVNIKTLMNINIINEEKSDDHGDNLYLYRIICDKEEFFIASVGVSIQENTLDLSDLVLKGLGHLPL